MYFNAKPMYCLQSYKWNLALLFSQEHDSHIIRSLSLGIPVLAVQRVSLSFLQEA